MRSEIVLTLEQRAAIGSVAMEATYLELHVEAVIWMLAGIDARQGPFFTVNVQLGNRLELLRDLGRSVLADQQLTEFDDLVSELKGCNADRNRVIHGAWVSQADDFLQLVADGPEKHPPAIARKANKKGWGESISASEIMEVARRIADRRERLGEFVHRTWPNGSLQRPAVRGE